MRLRIFAAGLIAVVAVADLDLSSADAAAALIYVDLSGTDNNTCGAPSAPCKTFQRGVDRAAEGDTVFLSVPGDYGPATIDKSVLVRAVKGAGVFSPASTPCVT